MQGSRFHWTPLKNSSSDFGWGIASPPFRSLQSHIYSLYSNFHDLRTQILTPETTSLLASLAQSSMAGYCIEKHITAKQFELGSWACRYCNFNSLLNSHVPIQWAVVLLKRVWDISFLWNCSVCCNWDILHSTLLKLWSTLHTFSHTFYKTVKPTVSHVESENKRNKIRYTLLTPRGSLARAMVHHTATLSLTIRDWQDSTAVSKVMVPDTQ